MLIVDIICLLKDPMSGPSELSHTQPPPDHHGRWAEGSIIQRFYITKAVS